MLGTVTRKGAQALRLEKGKWSKLKRKVEGKARFLLIDKGWLLMIIALLLGRAVILSSISPFVIALIASVWWLRRDRVPAVILFAVIGASTYGWMQTGFVFVSMLTFLLLAFIVHTWNEHQKILPLMALLACVIPRAIALTFMDAWQPYEALLMTAEGVLSAMLVLIFMQSVPLLSPKRYKASLKNEEIVCMIILLASVLTGTIGWQIQDISLEQIFSRYLVLFLAYIGGAAIGSTVGVVTGLIMSLANVANLYQMSLLAFSGLLGGLLKEGRKIGVSLGLVVGTLLIGVYGGGISGLSPSLIETVLAIGLFMLTPEGYIRKLSRFIPGTQEHSQEQEQYLQKVRDVTAVRVEKFSDVFQALSKSFNFMDNTDEGDEEQREKDYFLSHVTEKTCQSCFKKERCWARQFDETYGVLTDLMTDLDTQDEPSRAVRKNLEQYCVKPQKMIDTMKYELSFYHANQQLKKQVMESRRFVADQLRGVSEVMGDFAKEIAKERENHENQEQEITYALNQLGLEIETLDIYTLDSGNIDIDLSFYVKNYHGEGPKLIAPLLSDILQETVVVTKEDIAPFPNGYCELSFQSAKRFTIEPGVAHAAKDGGFISGDSYSMIELGAGKYALAISDGMGNGLRAHEESMETLRLLQQILQSGIPEQVAIKSINSILALRTTDEIFSTLDLAVIDLQDAAAKFIKIGSTPSYIKRGAQMLKIESSNLPIGIIQDVDVEIVNEHLQAGDLLIMMSDGILEGPKHVENIEAWLKRKIREMETNEPQAVADLILEEVIRTRGSIQDDMTVLVARIDHNIPKWSSIPYHKKQA
ncbi:stage II sporulation protein E [Thalassobacillus pellis]|uniref:stage II sporulation protein E n=1 Tax=Thalassobacillus pellis TaxID=748008 RepID=UPI0019617994|nr:stage II sporulation protein E [Thalassobacillus pellis]MBM7555140.1 stage II sporulation protein E [Thalassobacillus pellis]